VEYCFTEEPIPGPGNQSVFPLFSAQGLVLNPFSPCIDAGSSAMSSYDLENPDNVGFALFPAQGTLHNDVGAYGGPLAMELPVAGLEGDFELLTSVLNFGETEVGQNVSRTINFKSFSGTAIEISQVQVLYQDGEGINPDQSLPWILDPLDSGSLIINWAPSVGGDLSGSLAIHHNCALYSENPLVIPFSGAAIQASAVGSLPNKIQLFDNFPNPFNPQTKISFYLPENTQVSLDIFDLHGRLIRNLVSREVAGGSHSVIWNGVNQEGFTVPSGSYFYRLRTAGQDLKRSMLLVK